MTKNSEIRPLSFCLFIWESILNYICAYAIMPVGKRIIYIYDRQQKPRKCTRLPGFSVPILVWKGLTPQASYRLIACLTICRWDGKSHLPQQPPKKIWPFPCVHLPPVAGSRLDNAVSITQNIRSENARIENMCVLLCAFWGFHFQVSIKTYHIQAIPEITSHF